MDPFGRDWPTEVTSRANRVALYACERALDHLERAGPAVRSDDPFLERLAEQEHDDGLRA